MSDVVSVSDLTILIGNYRQQHQAAEEQIRILDTTRAQTVRTLDLLQGAIVALETLRDSLCEVPATPPSEESPSTGENG